MKNLLILAMLTIFIFACKDEGAAGPQEEEVIEEIIYFIDSRGNGDGFFCDSLILNEDSTSIIYRKYCEDLPFYKNKFYNKNVESFIDTLNGKQNILNIENDFDDITKYLDIDSFFELNDSVSIKYPGFFHWSILVRTNKRDKNIYVYVNPTSTNILVEDLVYLLVNFNNYHQRRIANLLGGWE